MEFQTFAVDIVTVAHEQKGRYLISLFIQIVFDCFQNWMEKNNRYIQHSYVYRRQKAIKYILQMLVSMRIHMAWKLS